LYHTLRKFYLFPLRHKALIVWAGILLAFLAWLAPLFQFIPQALILGRGFLDGSVGSLRSSNDRTNFLILGLGGHKNDPAGMTDTQLLVSYDHANARHLMLSIPRDIWIPEINGKINSAYSYGNNSEGSGIDLTNSFMSQITGQPVHYSVVISFDGFVKVIDLLGGVDVGVDRSFTDPKYPVSGRENDLCDGDAETKCRWETLYFEQGKHHFNGTEALKFVRSRHAQGEEGTDFARAVRQQKVVLAVKEKLQSPFLWANPWKINQLLTMLGDVVETDIPQKDLGILARLFIFLNRQNVKSEILSVPESAPSLLFHPPVSPKYSDEWVLIPEGGNWDKVHLWVSCLLAQATCSISTN